MLNTTHAVLGDALALLTDPALAYIGPGAGLGGLAIVIALGLGVLLLLVGLVWYPLKRVLRSRSGDTASGSQADEAE